MLASRTLARASRTARPAARAVTRQSIRLESTQATAAKAGGSSGLVGGLIGGGLVFAAGYGYYHMSGAKTLVNTATSAKRQFDAVTSGLKDKTPEPNEILKWFRQTASSYAVFIPGAKSFVDKAFNDLDKVEQKHRGEINDIATKAYNDLRSASKSGLSADTMQQSWEIVQTALKRFADLAQDASGDLLDAHPELKDKFDGNLKQLKSLADSYGPEAKKEVEKTYSQVKELVAGGVGISTIPKIKKLVEEQMQKLQGMGDKSWQMGLEAAKPYLDKSPKIKALLEENADALKSGNLMELWDKVKGGDLEDVTSYVKSATDKARQSTLGGLGDKAQAYSRMIPGGGEVLEKLQTLAKVAGSNSDKAEALLKETYAELVEVLQAKTAKAEKLAKQAAAEAEK